MLVGHYAAGFAIRRFTPRVPLSALLLATQIVDVAWALLVLAGIERVEIVRGFTASNDMDLVYVPFTHSLAATVVWIVGAGFLARWLWPDAGPRGAALVALAVASHWLGDLPVHTADLPLFRETGYKFGFGLWNHRNPALAFELGLLGAGVAVWARGLRRPAVAWGFFAVLAVIQVVTVFRPTPPTSTLLASGLLVFYLLVTVAAVVVARLAEGPPAPAAAPPG